MKQKLTFKSVKTALAPLGVTVRKLDTGEILVRLKGSPAGNGAFCTDTEDALATGKTMAKFQASNLI